MAGYVVIGSEDPFEDGRGQRTFRLAASLADHGDDVTVYLAQNAVLGCRRGSTSAEAVGSLAAKARTFADDFSLRERGVSSDELVAGVEVGSVDALVEAAMAPGNKVLWT